MSSIGKRGKNWERLGRSCIFLPLLIFITSLPEGLRISIFRWSIYQLGTFSGVLWVWPETSPNVEDREKQKKEAGHSHWRGGRGISENLLLRFVFGSARRVDLCTRWPNLKSLYRGLGCRIDHPEGLNTTSLSQGRVLGTTSRSWGGRWNAHCQDRGRGEPPPFWGPTYGSTSGHVLLVISPNSTFVLEQELNLILSGAIALPLIWPISLE